MLPAALLKLPKEARNIIADYLDIWSSYSNKGGSTQYGDLFSISQALNLMLIQSHDGAIELFPACPDNWEASFKLRAEGAVLVEAIREKGKLGTCNLLSLRYGKVCVKNGWNNAVDVYESGKVVLSTNEEVICWKAGKGKTYLVASKGTRPTLPFLSMPRKRKGAIKKFRSNQLGL
jgi:hypothetical protein